MFTALKEGYQLPPLLVRVVDRSFDPRLDARIEVTADGSVYEFDAEFRARSTPKMFEEAVLRLIESTRGSNRRGLLVTPYLRESQLEELRRRQLSGVDLCGNAIVIVPGELFVYRTGKPNLYRESTPTRFAYRGATSLVARVFLCRAAYDSLADIADELEKRGGRVVLSTISKALKRMESDLIVQRSPGEFRLRQPERLLDALLRDYRPPKVTRTTALEVRELKLEELVGRRPPEVALTLTGDASISQYTETGRTDRPVFYTTDAERLLRTWTDGVRQTSRSIDLELRQTDDPTVYFDTQDFEGLPYASPIQAYLEGSTGGGERVTLENLRKLILIENNAQESYRRIRP